MKGRFKNQRLAMDNIKHFILCTYPLNKKHKD